MFGYKYKADALKWRAQEKKKISDAADQKWKMDISVELFTGEVLKKTYERTGHLKYYYNDPVPDIFIGERKLKNVWNDLKEKIGKYGFELNGKFYPHSQIASVTRSDIKVAE